MTEPRTESRRLGELMLQTKGWQVASIDDNVTFDGSRLLPITQQDEAAVLMNCYPPGTSDEMHCHPKEEHVFMVWKGQLHITGVEDGEEMTLREGQLVHIDANYYYRLHNPGTEPAVYLQFRTLPAKPPKRRMVLFSESARGKREAATK
ncbi:MAG: Mannose-6-phosphate isomerase [Chloroflexota bacterium]|jgi:quercetin dioxygenase-like cupin family protein|nr:Mannose-6-phosphate isomerase [Chloroflexota bacterium]